MSEPRLRPTFHRAVSADLEQVQQSLRAYPWPPTIRFSMRGNHAQCTLVSDARRWWSPWLEIDLEQDAKEVHLNGRFSANPSFFTLWMAMLALCVFSTFGFLGFGLSQWLATEFPWGFLGAAAAGPLAVGLAFLPLYGQAKGKEQCALLSHAVDSALALLQSTHDEVLALT